MKDEVRSTKKETKDKSEPRVPARRERVKRR